MIELLILFVLLDRDRTMYGIRKEIISLFGAISQPSDGTIYPALERLKKQNCISVNEIISEGGKKSTYYSLQKDGRIKAKNLFVENSAENPAVFYKHIVTKLAVMSLFDKETQMEFIENNLINIDVYRNALKNAIEDEYQGLDYFQKNIYEELIKQCDGFEALLNRYKNECNS